MISRKFISLICFIFNLKIFEAPPIIDDNSPVKRGRESHSLSVECKVDGFPLQMLVSWSKVNELGQLVEVTDVCVLFYLFIFNNSLISVYFGMIITKIDFIFFK